MIIEVLVKHTCGRFLGGFGQLAISQISLFDQWMPGESPVAINGKH
jgi:hypothetical protein